MAIPSAPAPPPDPVPTSPAGCATPDPFVGIPGLAGICTAGNWTPTQLVSDSGTVRFRTEAGGFWAIELDDGRVFVPLGGLPAAFETPDLRVTFTAKLRGDQTSPYGTVIEITDIN